MVNCQNLILEIKELISHSEITRFNNFVDTRYNLRDAYVNSVNTIITQLQNLYDYSYKCCIIESKPKGPISIVNFNLLKGQLKDPKGPRLARGPRSGDPWRTNGLAAWQAVEGVLAVEAAIEAT